MNDDLGNKFQLAARFVELLADRAMRTGHVAPSWEKLPPAWKSIFAATVLAFLEERGCGLIANEAMSEKQEDEQIRLFCEGLTAPGRTSRRRRVHCTVFGSMLGRSRSAFSGCVRLAQLLDRLAVCSPTRRQTRSHRRSPSGRIDSL
jgi:hypothetical protein